MYTAWFWNNIYYKNVMTILLHKYINKNFSLYFPANKRMYNFKIPPLELFMFKIYFRRKKRHPPIKKIISLNPHIIYTIEYKFPGKNASNYISFIIIFFSYFKNIFSLFMHWYFSKRSVLVIQFYCSKTKESQEK